MLAILASSKSTEISSLLKCVETRSISLFAWTKMELLKAFIILAGTKEQKFAKRSQANIKDSNVTLRQSINKTMVSFT